MSLDLIGAGFGRTGTMSLKLGLEQLGLAPCYHMMEVFQNPDHVPTWDAAAHGAPTDWRSVLGGYRAAVDWPVCHFWRELAEAFPQAKFLLTERDPQGWYKSISQTIFVAIARGKSQLDDPVRGPMARMVRHLILEKTFAGDLGKENAIAVYKAHNEAVKRALPPERLLVYDVSQGWEPLCRHLGVAVPAGPFPRTNSTDEFLARFTEG